MPGTMEGYRSIDQSDCSISSTWQDFAVRKTHVSHISFNFCRGYKFARVFSLLSTSTQLKVVSFGLFLAADGFEVRPPVHLVNSNKQAWPTIGTKVAGSTLRDLGALR